MSTKMYLIKDKDSETIDIVPFNEKEVESYKAANPDHILVLADDEFDEIERGLFDEDY